MDRYHIALFVHILAVMVAAGATAVTKLAATRRARSKTVGEVLDWHGVLSSASKLFPMCLAAFVLTGAYMLSVGRIGVRSNGFVVAGIVGVVLLGATGGYLGKNGNALRKMLEQLAASKGADQPAPKLIPPPVVAALPLVNTGIAVAVVFDMVVKPTSVPIALGVVAIGIVSGAVKGMRRPAPAAQRVPLARSGRVST
jgi:hypothetical protein